MSESFRSLLRRCSLPAGVLLAITACLWIFWRHSEATDVPIADRRLHELYSLKAGEVLRLLPPPGIPERARYNVATRFGQLQNPSLIMWWDGRGVHTRAFGIGGYPLDRLLQGVGIDDAECEIEPGLKVQIAGDLIVRNSAPVEEKIEALETIVESVTGRTIRIERRATEREVIVATGTFAPKSLVSATLSPSTIHLYADETFGDGRVSGTGSGRVSALLQSLGRLADRPVINRTTTPPGTVITWALYVKPDQLRGDEAGLERLLKNLSAQTSLTFTREKRPSEIYYVGELK